MSEPVRVLLCTAPPDGAEALAGKLVERRLAACVNVVPGLVSLYRWQGELERDEEALLIIKCAEKRVEALLAALPDLHPYDVPEILSLPVEKGHAPYVEWVRRESAAE